MQLYSTFHFPAETKRMYQASRHLPDVQKLLSHTWTLQLYQRTAVIKQGGMLVSVVTVTALDGEMCST
jgi:hypothetical protein